MAKLNVHFEPREDRELEYSDQQLAESIRSILDANETSAMATVRDGESHIHTAYFVYNESLKLYWLSQPTEVHAANIRENPSIAVAIWNDPDPEEWGDNLQGLQIFGTCEEVPFFSRESAKAMRLFVQRFPAFKTIMKHPGEFKTGVTSRVYVVRSQWLKLLDEPCFGRRNYITLNIRQPK